MGQKGLTPAHCLQAIIQGRQVELKQRPWGTAAFQLTPHSLLSLLLLYLRATSLELA